VPVCRSPRARLRLPGTDPRGARTLRRHRPLPGGSGSQRRSAGDTANPDARRDRRVREGQDRRALPSRQALPRPRGRDPVLEDLLRTPARRPRRWRAVADRDLRARGRGRPARSSQPTSSGGCRCARSAAGRRDPALAQLERQSELRRLTDLSTAAAGSGCQAGSWTGSFLSTTRACVPSAWITISLSGGEPQSP